MIAKASADYLVDNSASCGITNLEQTRHLLTLLLEAERTVQGDPDIASKCLNQAIDLLGVNSQKEPLHQRNRGGLARWQISRVNEYIHQHLDQCIRTPKLAAILSLSVSHFSQAFKQTTGSTPLMYVTAARVDAAGHYMLSSAQSLSEIALRHGFCDQSHFCRVFRRQTGMSPHAWRKLHTANSPSPDSH